MTEFPITESTLKIVLMHTELNSVRRVMVFHLF